MHPAQIQAALKMRGYTQTDVAEECGGISQASVWNVIQGRSRSKRVEMRIAAITGQPLADLWPRWYGPNANTKRRPAMTQEQFAEALRKADAHLARRAG